MNVVLFTSRLLGQGVEADGVNLPIGPPVTLERWRSCPPLLWIGLAMMLMGPSVNADSIHSLDLGSPAETVTVTVPSGDQVRVVADSLGLVQFDGVGAGVYRLSQTSPDTGGCPPDTVVIHEPIYICERCDDLELRGIAFTRYLDDHYPDGWALWQAVVAAKWIGPYSCDQLRDLMR